MRRRGFSLVEVVVAVLVLEVGILGSMGLVLAAARTLRAAEALEVGVAAVEGVADSLAGVSGPVSGRRIGQHGLTTWTVSGGTVRIRHQPVSGAPSVEAAVLVAAQAPP